ncbi:MAG: MFS transporter, partial [Acidobacteriota bacterium]
MVPIFLIVLVDLLALSVILPLLPFYAESLGASPWVVGLLLSTFAFCQLVAGPPLGQYSDRVGRKRVLLLSQVGTFAGFVLLGFARTLWLVFLSRIIDGLTAGNLTVAQAYISDVTAPEDRARAFGIVGMAFGIGFLLGPALSGYLVQFGPSYPIFAAAGFSAASIVATAVLLPPSPAVQAEGHQWDWRAYTGPLRDRMVASRFFQFFLSQFAISTFFSGFA